MKSIKQHYVYKIVNINTNQYYIGVRSTKDIKQDKYMGSSSIWTKDYIKENQQYLKKLILAIYESRRLANKGELEYLKIVEGDSFCVNILYKKVPSHFGKKQTPEQIAKRIKSGKDAPMYGRNHTEESKQKIKNNSPFKGKKRPQAFADNMSKLQKGKVVSEKTKLKSSETKKKKFASGETKGVSRSILVIDLLLDTESTFKSLKEFCVLNNLNYGSLKVYTRKNMIYKERYKITYTSKLQIQL